MLDLTSPMHLLLILLIVLLLFGGSKIPAIMKGMGAGVKEFKKASHAEDKAGIKEGERIDADRK